MIKMDKALDKIKEEDLMHEEEQSKFHNIRNETLATSVSDKYWRSPFKLEKLIHKP